MPKQIETHARKTKFSDVRTDHAPKIEQIQSEMLALKKNDRETIAPEPDEYMGWRGYPEGVRRILAHMRGENKPVLSGPRTTEEACTLEFYRMGYQQFLDRAKTNNHQEDTVLPSFDLFAETTIGGVNATQKLFLEVADYHNDPKIQESAQQLLIELGMSEDDSFRAVEIMHDNIQRFLPQLNASQPSRERGSQRSATDTTKIHHNINNITSIFEKLPLGFLPQLAPITNEGISAPIPQDLNAREGKLKDTLTKLLSQGMRETITNERLQALTWITVGLAATGFSLVALITEFQNFFNTRGPEGMSAALVSFAAMQGVQYLFLGHITQNISIKEKLDTLPEFVIVIVGMTFYAVDFTASWDYFSKGMLLKNMDVPQFVLTLAFTLLAVVSDTILLHGFTKLKDLRGNHSGGNSDMERHL